MHDKRNLILPAVLLALLLLVSSVSGVMIYRKTENEKTLAGSLSALEEALLGAQAQLAGLEKKLSAAQSERDEYIGQLNDLEERLSGVEDDALLLEGKREELTAEIRLLRLSIEEKEAQIDALETDILRFNQVYSIDVRRQAALVGEILNALEKEAPLRRIAKLDKDGNTVEAPAAEKIVREDDEAYYVYPSLALYYEDLSTGYHLEYRADEIFFSASLIKAPYLLWLLEAISAEEDAARLRAEEARVAQTTDAVESPADAPSAEPETSGADEPASPDTVASAEKSEPEFIFLDERYDLSRIFTYTEESFREGSGIIQHAEEGTEYTYRQLCELAITKSDNVAFGELRNVFGYSDFYSFNTRLGVNSVRARFNDINAADMARYLRAMYAFIEEDENYGEIFKSWLCSSAHSVLIPYAVYPTPAAHKYGWDIDAYHDAAIVYDEHPYLLVVLTDLDDGGTEVDTYLRGVIKKVAELHRQFYR